MGLTAVHRENFAPSSDTTSLEVSNFRAAWAVSENFTHLFRAGRFSNTDPRNNPTQRH